jgi:hypothetical protein
MNFGWLGSNAVRGQTTIDTGDAFLDGPILNLATSEARSDCRDGDDATFQPESGILLQATIASDPMATDLNGNLVVTIGNDFNTVGRSFC